MTDFGRLPVGRAAQALADEALSREQYERFMEYMAGPDGSRVVKGPDYDAVLAVVRLWLSKVGEAIISAERFSECTAKALSLEAGCHCAYRYDRMYVFSKESFTSSEGAVNGFWRVIE